MKYNFEIQTADGLKVQKCAFFSQNSFPTTFCTKIATFEIKTIEKLEPGASRVRRLS